MGNPENKNRYSDYTELSDKINTLTRVVQDLLDIAEALATFREGTRHYEDALVDLGRLKERVI